jgi:hypothetical protein
MENLKEDPIKKGKKEKRYYDFLTLMAIPNVLVINN